MGYFLFQMWSNIGGKTYEIDTNFGVKKYAFEPARLVVKIVLIFFLGKFTF
jgi:hypothetical protein